MESHLFCWEVLQLSQASMRCLKGLMQHEDYFYLANLLAAQSGPSSDTAQATDFAIRLQDQIPCK